jgi:hypothetical protein
MSVIQKHNNQFTEEDLLNEWQSNMEEDDAIERYRRHLKIREKEVILRDLNKL